MFSADPLFVLKDRGLIKPGLIGRIGRFIFGLWSLYFVRETLTYSKFFINDPDVVSQFGYLAGVAIAFWVLPDVVNIGFNRQWKNRSQQIVIALAAVALVVDFLVYGSWWGPPLGWVVLGMSVLTHLYLGSSHILAGLIATPGCEMRSIPHLRALLTKKSVETVVCPGHWTAIDRWEASVLK